MKKKQFKTPPVSEEARGIAGSLLKQFPNLALMSGKYGKKNVNFVVAVNKDGEDYMLTPLFIVVEKHMLNDLRDADGRKLE